MYAELLSNIRQISVIVALEEPCDLTTKVQLSADGRRFILHHGAVESSLDLPGQAPLSFWLQEPAFGANELTWRIPLAGQPTRASMDTIQSNAAPWSSKVLGEETEFMCRACGAVVVKRGSIRVWKDLPSENWAEMMDFWHCHKPDVRGAIDSSPPNEAVEQLAASRGYGAHTKFTPAPGIGFVDLTTFLLADADCQNIQVRYVSPLKTWPVTRSTARGIKKVARLAFAAQWLGRRYKYPKSTPCYHPVQQQSFMPTLFSGLWVTCLIGGYRPRHLTPYLPQDLGSHGISTRDIYWIHAGRGCLI
jgi:hypothetical protein